MEELVLSCLDSRVEENRSIYGRFLLGAFKNGNALTVATALRRSLLSQIQNVAVIALDIQGVSHEFSTITGVRESVLEVTLNFQQLILRCETHLKKTEVGYLQIQGPRVVYANDLKLPLGIECVNPTQYIATVARDGLLVIKFLIASSGHSKHLKINNTQLTSQQLTQYKKVLYGKESKELAQTCLQNILPLDSFLNPVNRVNFTVEKDDLFNQKRERLLLEIWTNGSIHPRQALNEAVFSLVTIFSAFRNLTHLDSYSWGYPDSRAFRLSKTKQEVTSTSNRVKEKTFSTRQNQQNQVEVATEFTDSFNLSLPSAAAIASKTFRKSKNNENIALQKSLKYSKSMEKRDIEENVRTLILRQLNASERFSRLYKTNLDKISFLASDISNFSFSLKTYTLLKQKGINKLEHLLQYSSSKLLKIVNGNKNMFYEIKRCLSKLGIEKYV